MFDLYSMNSVRFYLRDYVTTGLHSKPRAKIHDIVSNAPLIHLCV